MSTQIRPYTDVIEKLRHAGLRPTRQRLALLRILTREGFKHWTAEQVLQQAKADRIRVSLATIYNTLNQFKQAGLLREVVVDAGRSYFDTNTSAHHHFYDEGSGALVDIPGDRLRVDDLPAPPEGSEITGVEVIVRLIGKKS